jgi:ABC-type dipeptide/oligopeptide/nickel transport system ATPase component
MIGVTEATMPTIVRGGGCGESTVRQVLERIKHPHTIALKKFTPRKKVPDRKTKRIKTDGAIIISSELTNRDKIFNNARCNKKIAKMKRKVR